MLDTPLTPIPSLPGAPASASSPNQSAGQAPQADFAGVLAHMAQQTIDTMRNGEAAAVEGLKGNMPIQDVVVKVMAAEQALQTGIALRDKIVAAYLEINRMTI